MAQTQSIDFEIIKEPWNKYQISDNSTLKTRTILTKVERKMDNEKPSFQVDAQTITVINVDPLLKGPPNTKVHSAEDIRRTIEKEDMRYDTLSQEFNEYILDDGTKIKIYTNVTRISRSRLHDRNGDPVYSVDSSNQMEIKISHHYNIPSSDNP